MIFLNPYWLFLLPLALVPLLYTTQLDQAYPSHLDIPEDRLSSVIDVVLRVCGMAAIAGLILGLAQPVLKEQILEKDGRGAEIVLLMDRSSSMDNTFAGSPPDGSEESKSAAARRLIGEFIDRRKQDRFGIAAFSTSPMPVVPITDQREIINAAVAAMDRPGLAFTDIGRGLMLALGIHAKEKNHASRAIVVISDGAAIIDHRLQQRLRAAFVQRQVNLYWLYLRTQGSQGIFEVPAANEQDTPQVFPERHLNKFFQTLKVPYRAFEAESPAAIKTAIDEIDKLERMPITYAQRTPQQSIASYAYLLASIGLLALLAAGIFERRLSRGEPPGNKQGVEA